MAAMVHAPYNGPIYVRAFFAERIEKAGERFVFATLVEGEVVGGVAVTP